MFSARPRAIYRVHGVRSKSNGNGERWSGHCHCSKARLYHAAQCSYFTGIILVFDPFLIYFGVVWYSGLRKWYLRRLIFPRPGAAPAIK